MDTLRLGDAGVAAFVEETLAPMARAFGVAAALQRHLEAGGCTWAEHLVPEIEREGGIPEALLKGVAAELAAEGAPSVVARVGATETSRDATALAILLQATLHHRSQTRREITERSVVEAETLAEMVVDLRMAHYFVACKVKRQHWLSMIGDVTYEAAYKGDLCRGRLGLEPVSAWRGGSRGRRHETPRWELKQCCGVRRAANVLRQTRTYGERAERPGGIQRTDIIIIIIIFINVSAGRTDGAKKARGGGRGRGRAGPVQGLRRRERGRRRADGGGGGICGRGGKSADRAQVQTIEDRRKNTLKFGPDWARNTVRIYGDSDLIVQQASGRWACGDRLWPYFSAVKERTRWLEELPTDRALTEAIS